MNMFGIPNTGAQMCGTSMPADPKIEKLCARYFSLSLISPIAFYSDKNSQSTQGHPFNFTNA
jgi:alpha-glucosidase (family GH31 glycosyl hydrolase)